MSKRGARFHNNPDYIRWAIVPRPRGGYRIITGWEYPADAKDSIKPGQLPPDQDGKAKILARGGLRRLGLDPEDNADWEEKQEKQLWRIYTQGGRVDLGEGPWDSEAAAVAFAESEVGVTWTVRQDGVRAKRSDPRGNRTGRTNDPETSAARQTRRMGDSGYVSDGRVPGGGEYRWTVTFPNPVLAQGFAEAIVHTARKPVKRSGSSIDFVVGPNHWPGTLFQDELARFGGEHGYVMR